MSLNALAAFLGDLLLLLLSILGANCLAQTASDFSSNLIFQKVKQHGGVGESSKLIICTYSAGITLIHAWRSLSLQQLFTL